MSMDKKNTVEDFASIGMLDPTEKVKQALEKVDKGIKKFVWNNDVYPKEIMKACIKENRHPKCIFVPSRRMLRKMVKALLRKKPEESQVDFLLKFGLLDNPIKYLNTDNF